MTTLRLPHHTLGSPLVGAICLLILLASCRPEQPINLPEGPQEVTGILKPAPLSIARKGTHTIVVGGKETYMAESATVPLTQYEGEEVILKGTLSLNTHRAELPVLTITEVVSRVQAMREVTSKALKLRLEVPEAWRTAESAGTGGVLRFTGSGGSNPVLTISRSPLLALPAGSPVLVDALRGVRVVPGGSSDQIVYVQRGTDIVQFTFTPAGLDPLTAPGLFLKVLRSVRFTGLPQRSSAGTGTGTGGALRGQPCGGIAGILCPEGAYCAITDFKENIGVCVKRR